MPYARALRTLLAAALILPLGGCKTLTEWISGADEPALSVSGERRIFTEVPNYSKAPCEYQRAWAAHNSKVRSAAAGKEVVLKAPCEVDPALKPKSQQAPQHTKPTAAPKAAAAS